MGSLFAQSPTDSVSVPTYDLPDAVVTAVRPAVVAKQDTVEFNADSYHTAPNSTVDQLLKRLPGVEVGSDGSITSNGKTITKILVDGKEFFSDDPQMASKNLPTNMVEKVQVIDRKSDFSRLTGVDDGDEETVINLTVKKNMNNGWFGNVSAGGGITDKYTGSFVVNSFSNGNQFTLLGGLNNINESGFSDRGRGRFRDFGGSGGISTAQRLGANFNVGKEEIIRFGGNVLYSHSSRLVTQKTSTSYLFPDSVSYQDANSRTKDKGHNVNVDLRLQWNIDPNNTLDFRPRFSANFRNSEKYDSSFLRAGDPLLTPVNQNLNRQDNKGHSYETSGNLIFNHKFASHPGRAFSLSFQYSFSSTLQKSLSFSEILYFLLHDQDEELDRLIDSRNYNNSIDARATWTEPLGNPQRGNFLAFTYRARYLWSSSSLHTFNREPGTGSFDPDPSLPFMYDNWNQSLGTWNSSLGTWLSALGTRNSELGIPDYIWELDPAASNDYRSHYLAQEIQVGYKKVSKTLNLEAGVLLSPTRLTSFYTLNGIETPVTNNNFYASPYANIRVRFSQTSSLRANYRARSSNPSAAQLQPVADVTDPLNIKIGNPDLKPTFTQNIGINYSNFNSERQQSLMLMFNTSFALNSIVSRTVTDPETGGRTTTYSNVNGNVNLMLMGMFASPLPNRKWRVNARLNTRYSSNPGYINGEFNRSENISMAPSIGMTFSADIFQMSVNPNYSFSTIHNSLPQQSNRTTQSYGFSTDASLYLPFGLDLTTDLNFSANSGYTAGYNIRQWLWNAQLSYSFLKDRSLTFSVKAYDILHQKKNINRSISSSAIVDTEYNDLTRYVMFSLTYTFNTLKNKSSKGNGPDFQFDGPPPGPDRQGGGRERNRGFRPGGPGGPPR